MLPQVNPEIDSIMIEIYTEKTGQYWDPLRKMIDEAYVNLKFPFKRHEKQPPNSLSYISKVWTFEEYKGYIQTWSGLQAAIKILGFDPAEPSFEKISKA